MAAEPGARNNAVIGYAPVFLAAALFAWFASMVPSIKGGAALLWSVPWIPPLGIDLAFQVDGLSLTFALLITGIGTFVLLYSNSYLAGHKQYARFALFLWQY